MICDIVNPSDSYTLETDDFVLGAVAVSFLGNGQYGLTSFDDDSLRTPVLFGWDDWFPKNGVPDLTAYLEANVLKVADVLDSVMIGSPDDREHWAELKEVLPEDVYRERFAAWADKKRSSMNNIGKAAKSIAASIRARHAEKAAS